MEDSNRSIPLGSEVYQLANMVRKMPDFGQKVFAELAAGNTDDVPIYLAVGSLKDGEEVTLFSFDVAGSLLSIERVAYIPPEEVLTCNECSINGGADLADGWDTNEYGTTCPLCCDAPSVAPEGVGVDALAESLNLTQASAYSDG